MEINYNNIPMELKVDGLFCTWKLSPQGKQPINPVTGYFAKSNDKSTFHNYNTILSYLPEYYVHNSDGVLTGGLGLGIFNGFSAIDIDNCINEAGELTDLALDIIEYMQSYTEISPSGKGIRILFKTDILINTETHYIMNRNNGLEIYISENTNKYVTITGNKLGDIDTIKEIDITYILEKYMKKNNVVNKKNTTPVTNVDDKIKTALENNPKLYELWHKTPTGSGGSESEDDLSLLNILARVFYGDYNAIETAFESSPYFSMKDTKHQDKWLVRDDYKIQSIQKAITSFNNYKFNDDEKYTFNDSGNARKFVNMFGDRVKYNVENKAWVIWNGTFWETDGMGRIFNYADMVIESMRMEEMKETNMEVKKKMYSNINKALSSHGKKNMLNQAEYLDTIPVTNVSFDIDDLSINTKSGIINLKTGEIMPHDKNKLHSKIINLEISKNKPTKWIKFLNETYADNPDLVGYIQRLLGYILTGYTSEQALFIFHGDGSNGKSLLLETILKATGDYGTTTSSDILVQRGYADKTAELLAPLNNTRFVMVEETESDDRLKEATIKNLTSDYGKLQGRFMYGNFFSFKPKFKLIMATNYKPQIRGMDHGIWRRIKLIPHNIIIPDSKQDKMLGFKLEQELPEILWWGIEGAIEYLKNGLQEPQIIKEQVAEYRSESNIVDRWITDNCEKDDSYSEATSKLFVNFTEWAKTNNEHTMSMKHFGMILTRSYESARLKGVRSYKGLRIKTKGFMEKYIEAEVKE